MTHFTTLSETVRQSLCLGSTSTIEWLRWA